MTSVVSKVHVCALTKKILRMTFGAGHYATLIAKKEGNNRNIIVNSTICHLSSNLLFLDAICSFFVKSQYFHLQ